ncbi:MAG: pyruvate:ferredoxin (flavodoxin) oxidoreductase, partial [Acidimicrobiia bacterium]|nr:pyruvate:ferredoxin (flavodoxin) oxidoreductase [Acidimicrobiia bacterium]
QSEAGAAGTVHGSLQAGALTTTFTASQGLLLMLPNMFKIAGELTPAVFHIAARTVATHALSIFGDHSDVMSARTTGWAMLASASVQEAQDLALVSHLATLSSRVPFLHFFDGFRTSHEVGKIDAIDENAVRDLVDDDLLADHRRRALHPSAPAIRGTAQNADVFFQAREASNSYYAAIPGAVQDAMDAVAGVTGRQYHLFDYFGAPDAEKVVVLMGSGAGPAIETVERRAAAGEKVGAVIVRLFRPFSPEALAAAIPASVTSVAVLDRTKEPGAVGEPLYQDVVAALQEAGRLGDLTVVGGRYGLSSKEFTPAMLLGIFDELGKDEPKNHFTVGIYDDVSHLSLPWDDDDWAEEDSVKRALFYGLGSDGTVGANKASVKIIGEGTDLHAQGYFVYDSKKSGAVTVSHLRFGPDEIRSTYLIREAGFVACHHFGLMETTDVLANAARGATFLVNSPHGLDGTWDRFPKEIQQTILDKELEVWVVDGYQVAREAGLGGRVNTVLQTCFFKLSGILPEDEAIEAIKGQITKLYGKRGETVLRRNFDAVDHSLAALHRLEVPSDATAATKRRQMVPDHAPDFVQRVTRMMMEGKGDLLPVSALPVDGTFPTATTQWEKRSIAHEIPIWDPDICIDCGRCALVCPHAAIRMKAFDAGDLAGAPDSFQSKEAVGRELGGKYLTIQVAPDDCTGCGVCVDVCPATSKEVAKHKSINMMDKLEYLEAERKNYSFFLEIPEIDRTSIKLSTVKGTQLLKPLFEYSGACSGCGETPYVKLMSQLFGDRVVMANATGCSSIYGGNLPTTPYTVTDDGRGPAWSNSLFEDNAEFGLGMRMGMDHARDMARSLLSDLAPTVGDLAAEILSADQSDEAGLAAQRERITALDEVLEGMDSSAAKLLKPITQYLAKTSVWIMGGDGWAYDIGFGGLDHVLASGRNVNILVLDTEVYSNTGGQASKATPRAAVAKFAAGGKQTGKKDLGQIAMSYGNVYVAQVAMGANPTQTVRAFEEAEAHKGVSLILAYSPCIAHGIEMRTQMTHQKEATDSGYWPLFRYDPHLEEEGKPGLRLDSRAPTITFKEFASKENRFAMLQRVNPEHANSLLDLAQSDIDNRWQLYEQMVEIHRTAVYEEVTE